MYICIHIHTYNSPVTHTYNYAYTYINMYVVCFVNAKKPKSEFLLSSYSYSY